jgi:hypothetical protein
MCIGFGWLEKGSPAGVTEHNYEISAFRKSGNLFSFWVNIKNDAHHEVRQRQITMGLSPFHWLPRKRILLIWAVPDHGLLEASLQTRGTGSAVNILIEQKKAMKSRLRFRATRQHVRTCATFQLPADRHITMLPSAAVGQVYCHNEVGC